MKQILSIIFLLFTLTSQAQIVGSNPTVIAGGGGGGGGSETDPTVPSNVKAITGTNISNWNTAYGWGNHSSAGYLSSITYGTTASTSAQGNDSRINNGQTAFGWGNHASYGYLTSASSLPAANLTGSIDDARLSSNIPTLTGTQTFTNKTLTAPSIGGTAVYTGNWSTYQATFGGSTQGGNVIFNRGDLAATGVVGFSTATGGSFRVYTSAQLELESANVNGLQIKGSNATGSINFWSGVTQTGKIDYNGTLTLQNGGTYTADSNVRLLVGGNVKANQYRLNNLNTAPSSATDTGVAYEVRFTSSGIYLCIATNTWIKVAMATW